MGWIRQFTWYTLIALLACCVNQSSFDGRFSESAALSPLNFTAAPSDAEQFKFAVVGDLHISGGTTTRFQAILRSAAAEGAEFIALLGDLVDTGKAEDYTALRQALTDGGFSGKAIPVIGNHDLFADGWSFYRDQLGASHFTVDAGNSRFIVLDTGDGQVGEEQSEWLRAELEKDRPTHTFILSHYMPVVPGIRTYLRLVNETEVRRLMKLASANAVSGWFGGHYHSYLNEEVEGVRYLVAGGGGGRRMPPIEEYFYVLVTVDGASISYRRVRVD